MPLQNSSMFAGQDEENLCKYIYRNEIKLLKIVKKCFVLLAVPSQTMTPHDYQGSTTPMPGTTTGNRPVQSTLTYTHTMQPPHPTFCKS